jgi:RNA polymerase sigma-70 factor (ECF subfamily)
VGILKHKAADWYRSPSQRVMFHFVGDVDEDSEFDSTGTGAHAFGAQAEPFLAPDRALEERELHWAVERCIARLSAQARQVFAMREQLGYETDEVCRCLDISRDHCRMLLHRARVAMRSFLRDRFLDTRVEPSNEGSARRSADQKNSRHASEPRNDQLSDCTT